MPIDPPMSPRETPVPVLATLTTTDACQLTHLHAMLCGASIVWPTTRSCLLSIEPSASPLGHPVLSADSAHARPWIGAMMRTARHWMARRAVRHSYEPDTKPLTYKLAGGNCVTLN